jgi:DNA-binding PadR family transcriptional regulator
LEVTVLTRLFVLGLLLRRPMSGYEMQRRLQLNQTEQWAGILPGSIYHALKKLEREGLVALRETRQTGNRITAIYAITPAGSEEFRRLLREVWRTPLPHFPSPVYAALSFADDLPRDEVVRLLEEQIAALEGQLASWNAGEQIKVRLVPGRLPGYLAAIFDNGRAHMETDLRLLRLLRDTLPSEPPMEITIPALPDDDDQESS